MEKKFIGITKTHTFNDGGRLIKIGLPVDSIKESLKNGWLNIIVAKKKDAKGDEKDFYCYVDTFEPKSKQELRKSPAELMGQHYTPPVKNQDIQEDDYVDEISQVPFQSPFHTSSIWWGEQRRLINKLYG